MEDYGWILKVQDMVSPAVAQMAAAYQKMVGKMNSANGVIDDGIVKVAKQVNNLRSEMLGLNKANTKIHIDTSDIDNAAKKVDELGYKIDKQGRYRDAKGRYVGMGGGNGFGGLPGIAGAIMPYAGMAGAAYAAKEFLGSSITKGMTAERDEFQIGAMLHDQKAGKVLAGQLRKYGEQTMFSNEDALTTGKYLVGMGEVGRAVPLVKMLGDIAAGSGNSMGDLAMILSQVKSKGRLQAEEVNQFAERRVNVREYLAKALGINETGLAKKIESGTVSYETLVKALEAMRSKGGIYENMAGDIGNKTNFGAWEQLTGAWEGKMADLGRMINEGGLGDVIKLAQEFVDKSDPLIEAFGGIISNTISATKGILDLVGAILGINNNSKDAKDGLWIITKIAQGISVALGGIGIVVSFLAQIPAMIIKAATGTPWHKIVKEFDENMGGAIERSNRNVAKFLGVEKYKDGLSADTGASRDEKRKLRGGKAGSVTDTNKPFGLGNSGNGSLGSASGLSSTIQGQKPQIININMGKLMDKIELHAINLREGEEELVEIINSAIVRALQGSVRLSVS